MISVVTYTLVPCHFVKYPIHCLKLDILIPLNVFSKVYFYCWLRICTTYMLYVCPNSETQVGLRKYSYRWNNWSLNRSALLSHCHSSVNWIPKGRKLINIHLYRSVRLCLALNCQYVDHGKTNHMWQNLNYYVWYSLAWSNFLCIMTYETAGNCVCNCSSYKSLNLLQSCWLVISVCYSFVVLLCCNGQLKTKFTYLILKCIDWNLPNGPLITVKVLCPLTKG